MNIIERTLNDVTVLDLEGNLALEGNKQFRLHVAAAIDAGVRKLILNLAGVPYMDSSGLGELISCYTAMQKLSGSVKLLHPSKRHSSDWVMCTIQFRKNLKGAPPCRSHT